jgi:hypothetical protein
LRLRGVQQRTLRSRRRANEDSALIWNWNNPAWLGEMLLQKQGLKWGNGRKKSHIYPKTLTLINRISALTKLFSARKAQKIISNLLRKRELLRWVVNAVIKVMRSLWSCLSI